MSAMTAMTSMTSISGFLPVLKPPGMTAHDVVAFLRRRLGVRRIGHAGTLDPLAAGVLPVAVGPATRLIRFLRHDKEYRGEILFGKTTNTLDLAGETILDQPFPVEEDALRAVLPRFQGPITQRAPMVSAVQVGGKRLYSLARQGIEIERPIRNVEIYDLELLRFSPGESSLYPRALLRIHCAGGTYIRSLAEDLGEALGGPAVLAFLLRTQACGLPIEGALTLDEVDPSRLLSPERVLAHLERYELDEDSARRFLHGQLLPNPGLSGDIRMVYDEHLLGIASAGDVLKPQVVFSEDA